MSSFAINKFDDETPSISTSLRFTNNCLIHSIRMKVLKHGQLANGNLTLELISSNSTVIASKTLTYQDINQINGTYAHGFILFELDQPTKINIDDSNDYVSTTLKLTMSNHTSDENNYIALIKEENPFTDEFGERPASISNEFDVWFNPYGIEIYAVAQD